jgi:hypothetical protein
MSCVSVLFLVTLVVLVLIVWLIQTLTAKLFMPVPHARVIYVVLAVIVILWLLVLFGVVGSTCNGIPGQGCE